MSEVVRELVRSNIRDLGVYQPGKPVEEVERELGISGVIKIASNENPLGPSPLAMAAARAAVEKVHMYPDGAAYYLRTALGAHLGVAPDRLVFGAGCNEVIQMLIQVFCTPGEHEVLSHNYAFISYRLLTLGHGCTFVAADTTEDLACDVDAMLAKVTERTRIIFVANPNNPTGSHVSRGDLEKLLAGAPPRCLVVIDEAYQEYAVDAGADYPLSQDYAEGRPLLVTLRTFSKIYGLAGLRVGYGICDAEVANYINRIRRPFNVNLVAQEAARAALADVEFVARSTQVAREGVASLSESARSLGLRPYPSLGNFVLVDVGQPAEEAQVALMRRGVITRPMAVWGLPTHLRISVGAESETARAIAAMKEVFA